MNRLIRFYSLKLCSWMSNSVWSISPQFRTIKTQQRLNCLSVGRRMKLVQFASSLNESLAGEWRIEFGQRQRRFTQLSAVNCHLSRQKCWLYVCDSRLYMEQHSTIAFWHVSPPLSPTHTLSLSVWPKAAFQLKLAKKYLHRHYAKSTRCLCVRVCVCMTIADFPGKVGCTHYVCHAPASINQSKLSNAYKLYASSLHCPTDAAVGVEMLPGPGAGAGPGTQPDRTITRHVLHKCNMHTTYTWREETRQAGEAECKGTCVGSLDRIWFWFGIGLRYS